MTSEAPLWLEIAIDKLGQTEIEGPHHNPRILAYHQATSLKAADDETPWCAAFVNWCLSEARIVGTNKANARSFLNWGQAIAIGKMRHGDIVIFERNTIDLARHDTRIENLEATSQQQAVTLARIDENVQALKLLMERRLP